MKHLFLTLLLGIMFAQSHAQTVQYQVVATAKRDMQTEKYVAVAPDSSVITRMGDTSISIGDSIYSVISVDKSINLDSLKTVQYTAKTASGGEYILMFTDDLDNKVDLMKHQVVLFNTSHPYDWTYYFIKEYSK